MKKIIRIIAWTFIVLVILMGFVYVWAWKSPAYYTISGTYATKDSIIPFKDYHLISDHARPYIVEGKNLVIFGVSHTRDAQSPEIKQIEEKWNNLQPTVALIEEVLAQQLQPTFNPGQIALAVKELLAKNEKVFVICGFSHAAGVEPAFTPKQPVSFNTGGAKLNVSMILQ